MTAKTRKKPDLIEKMDEFAMSLIKDVRGNTISGVPEDGELKARVDVFNAVVRWTMIRNKVYPEDEGESGLERLIGELDITGGKRSGEAGRA